MMHARNGSRANSYNVPHRPIMPTSSARMLKPGFHSSNTLNVPPKSRNTTSQPPPKEIIIPEYPFISTFLFTDAEMMNSPSRIQHNITADEELRLRQIGTLFIRDLVNKLNGPQFCRDERKKISKNAMSVAFIIFHRFYMYHSFVTFDPLDVATAALFLAAKCEECPRRMLEFSILLYHAKHPKDNIKLSNHEAVDVNNLITALETCIIRTLAFELKIVPPHITAVSALKPQIPGNDNLRKLAFRFSTDVLMFTDLCLRYTPEVIGAGMLLVASIFYKKDLKKEVGEDWYKRVSPDCTEEIVFSIAKVFSKALKEMKPILYAERRSDVPPDEPLIDYEEASVSSSSSETTRRHAEHEKPLDRDKEKRIYEKESKPLIDKDTKPPNEREIKPIHDKEKYSKESHDRDRGIKHQKEKEVKTISDREKEKKSFHNKESDMKPVREKEMKHIQNVVKDVKSEHSSEFKLSSNKEKDPKPTHDKEKEHNFVHDKEKKMRTSYDKERDTKVIHGKEWDMKSSHVKDREMKSTYKKDKDPKLIHDKERHHRPSYEREHNRDKRHSLSSSDKERQSSYGSARKTEDYVIPKEKTYEYFEVPKLPPRLPPPTNYLKRRENHTSKDAPGSKYPRIEDSYSHKSSLDNFKKRDSSGHNDTSSTSNNTFMEMPVIHGIGNKLSPPIERRHNRASLSSSSRPPGHHQSNELEEGEIE